MDAPVVLCVDRSVAEVPWLRAVLTELGWVVRTARHGEAALDQVAVDPPDLVLIGLEVPGLDGLEVCRRITGEPRTRHLPVFMVAGGPSADSAPALAAGAEHLLSPPATRQEVRLRLLNAVRHKLAWDEAESRWQTLEQVTAARDRLVDLSLSDIETMLATAQRALAALLDPSDPTVPVAVRSCARLAWRECEAVDQTAHTLRVIRSIESGGWTFQPRTVAVTDLVGQVVESSEDVSGSDAHLTGAAQPDLLVTADPALVAHGLAALVAHVAGRRRGRGAVALDATAGEGGDVRFRIRAEGPVDPPDEAADRLTAALQFTLARMVAEAHGGRLVCDPARPEELGLDLPSAPPAGLAWPPSSLPRRDAPMAAGRAPSEEAEAADIAAARSVLTAPPRPPRLMPPTTD